MSISDASTATSDGDASRAASGSRGSAYAELSRQIKQAGLLNRRPGYYTRHAALLLVLCVASAVAFFTLGDSWWQVAVAAFLAVVSTQLGFFGHDAGHRQIATSGRTNDLIGTLLACLGVGFSYRWWVSKHSRHHAHPNDQEKDPDVGPGALVFTTGQLLRSRPVARAFYRYQAWLFFPLLLLEAVNLRVSSVRHLIRDRRHGIPEGLLIATHLGVYFSAVFLVLSPVKAVVFIAVHQCLFGLYLGCSFAPNHKGMPTLSADEAADYLRRQVLTSRNVRGHWTTDFALGGLNYQIEHHLFPSMPRPNLRRAQSVVENFCRTHQVSYLETSLFASYAQALRHLNAVGRAARAEPAPFG
jgi:fatty acid desaturase